MFFLLFCLDNGEQYILPVHAAQAAEAWAPYGRGAGHATASYDSVSFQGHPTDPFVALLFRPANDGDYRTLTFHLSEGVSDWHTIEGNGFIWNAGISNNTLSGDAVMFGQNNVGFYKLTNVPLASLSSAHFTACPGVTLVDSIGKPAYSSGTTWYLKLVMSPGSLLFEKYTNPGFTGTPEVLFNKTFPVNSHSYSGYGPFASFVSHNCSSISTSSFDYFNLTIKPNTPPAVIAPDVALKRGETFSQMAGVSAVDAEDGNLTSKVQIASSNVNTQVPGVYQVQYSVKDILDLEGTCTRTVAVLADALFHATNQDAEEAVPGLGITVDNPVGALETGSDGQTSVFWVTPNTYSWGISTQHEDYLPDYNEYSTQIDSASNDTWPMVIPIQLEKKYRDAAAVLALGSIAGKPVEDGDTARYNQEVEFTLTITSNSNESINATVKLEVPKGLEILGDALLTTQALTLGESETFTIKCRVTSLADTQTATLKAGIVSVALSDTGEAVMDENPENDHAFANLQIKNVPIVITKTDALANVPLVGVQLEIKRKDVALQFNQLKNGAWVPPTSEDESEEDETAPKGIPTDAYGKLTIYGLHPGEYTLLETKALPGYALPDVPWHITIDENAEAVGDLIFTNNPTHLRITKVNAISDKPLDGAVFRLLDAEGKPIFVTAQEGGFLKPDIEGKETFTTRDSTVMLAYLPLGKLTLEETTAPAGFAKGEPIPIEITSEHIKEKALEVKVGNKPLALKIKKVDKLNQPLTGAGFSLSANGNRFRFIKDANGTLWPDEKGIVTDILVDERGEALIYGLPEGSYSLVETVVPEGFVSAVPKTITIAAEHTSDKPYEATIINEPFIKLGFDNDGWILPVGISLLTASAILGGYAICRCFRGRKTKNEPQQ